MPHLMVDYSANLEDAVDMAAFCNHLREAATGIEAFPTAGIRVRAFAATHVSIADGNPDHAYIDISVRLRAGRPLDVRKSAATDLFDAARSFLDPVFERRSIALSLEMRDIDAELAPRDGTIRQHTGA